MRCVIFLALATLAAMGCGSGACDDYCSSTCEKLATCQSIGEVDACVSSCGDSLDAQRDAVEATGQSLDQKCESATAFVGTMTCEELADFLGLGA